MSKNRNAIRRITHVSLLITLAIVIRNFSYMFYIGGVATTRVSFSGIFTRLAAILFGPFYGGLASGIQDVIGYNLKPEGPYIPWMTMSAVLGGVLAGWLWRLFGRMDYSRPGKYFLLLFGFTGLIGGTNQLVLSLWPESRWSRLLNSFGTSRDLLTVGLIMLAGIGLGLYLVNALIKRISGKWQNNEYFFKVLITVGVSGFFITTANTWILQSIFPELAEISFLVFLIPRIIKEAIVVIIQSYLITFLLTVYNRHFVPAGAGASH